ncbi:hypothetical protein J8J14_16925 [Roseomonas sp. SSH11]|uniref:Sigma-like protein n=1 Tax=Pararoseomonas baculiformis TaxID=2820812 RepID=A0ABS4AHI6_9PROT|nr:hypothetical protein [Pararoseomonas baculiformis]MBP0446461.1 hypothetical protein [Pararoseomonas baculiformis]
MSAKDNKPSPVPEPSAQDPAHTEGGAPTDAAHQADGDGTLTGSVPAGLSADELHKIAESDKTGDTGTS